MVAFAALPRGVSLAAILPCAVVAGAALPPLGACLRTLWPALLDVARAHPRGVRARRRGDRDRLHRRAGADRGRARLMVARRIGGRVRGAARGGDARVRRLAVVAGVAAGRARGGRRGAARAGRADAGGGVRPDGAGVRRDRGVRPGRGRPAGHAGAAGLLLGGWGLGSFVGGVLATRAAGAARPGPAPVHVPRAAGRCGHLLLAVPDDLLLLGARARSCRARRSPRRSGSPTAWSSARPPRAR